jgi:hypothetical protein
MNRRDRRAAKRFNKGHVTHTAIGRLQAVDPNYGLPVNCYTCGAPHQGLGVGRIMDRGELEYVPLCEPCMATPEETTNAIIRKFWNAPDLICREGGEISDEQLDALAERGDASQH